MNNLLRALLIRIYAFCFVWNIGTPRFRHRIFCALYGIGRRN
jgi:hypothetical protein